MTSNTDFLELINAIVVGDTAGALDRLQHDPRLIADTATQDRFFDAIRHYIYVGDTALHMAAAAFNPDLVQALIDQGADVSARNRRGAQPLHYAADSNRWAPDAQDRTITCLIAAGADPNATDKSGVPPLHRAARTRCVTAVLALLAGGADPRRKNGKGSNALTIISHTTGRSGSGTERAREQQGQIIALLAPLT